VAMETDRRRRNKSARELAEQLGRSERWVRYARAERRASYEDRAAVRREQIVALHRRGRTGKQIAAELEVSEGLVSARLREARAAGVDLSPLPAEDQDRGHIAEDASKPTA
jgi:DNA-binding NarL/FixJ family response regulator